MQSFISWCNELVKITDLMWPWENVTLRGLITFYVCALTGNVDISHFHVLSVFCDVIHTVIKRRWWPFGPSYLHHINTRKFRTFFSNFQRSGHVLGKKTKKKHQPHNTPWQDPPPSTTLCVPLTSTLVLILPTSEGWQAESTSWCILIQRPTGLELRTLGSQAATRTTKPTPGFFLYPSISITSRFLSNSNLNPSTVSVTNSFPGRPFHALTTLWVKDPYLTTFLTRLFFTLKQCPWCDHCVYSAE